MMNQGKRAENYQVGKEKEENVNFNLQSKFEIFKMLEFRKRRTSSPSNWSRASFLRSQFVELRELQHTCWGHWLYRNSICQTQLVDLRPSANSILGQCSAQCANATCPSCWLSNIVWSRPKQNWTRLRWSVKPNRHHFSCKSTSHLATIQAVRNICSNFFRNNSDTLKQKFLFMIQQMYWIYSCRRRVCKQGQLWYQKKARFSSRIHLKNPI